MDANYPYDPSLPASSQLVEVTGTLSEAAELFVRPDASGRTPIVVSPQTTSRLLNSLVIAAGVILVVALLLGPQTQRVTLVIGGGLIIAIVLLVMGLLRAFTVTVPEGVYAMVVRRGKYRRTVGAGSHVLPPWFTVSHIVSSRVIPYNVSVRDVPTADNVRAELFTTVTIQVVDPFKFVYSVSTSAFDMVLQAACQDALRAMMRKTISEQVYDMAGAATDDVRTMIDADIAPYGVTMRSMNVLATRLPSAFMASQEARTLAVIQQEEQAQQQALALRRQTDAEALARQETIARIQREREALQLLSQQAEARRVVAELDAQTEVVRLKHAENAARLYPVAWEYESYLAQLEIAKALAANSRTIIQAATSNDLMSVVVSSTLYQELMEKARTSQMSAGEASLPAVVLDDPAARP